MFFKELIVCSCLLLLTVRVDAQHNQQYTTPVPILKQINRQNEDGSYSYGYEGADGSFKIETKYPTGEVYGKYGYVDAEGKVREVEYGASKRGFEPQGNDINVPPPTLNNNIPYPAGPDDVDDGQYHEDPSVYYKDAKFNKGPRLPASSFRLDNLQPNNHRYNAPAPQPQPYQNQYYNPNPQPVPQPRKTQFYQPPVHRFQQQPQQHQPYYQPANHYNHDPNFHHPSLRNLDLNSGSYSIDYTGRK